MNQYQKMINENSLADIEFRVKWKSPDATHTDTTLVMVNFWRDILPETVSDGLMGIGEGEQRIFLFSPGQLVPANSDRQQYHLKRSDFNEKMAAPAFGRFYPKGILQGLPNVFPQNMAPLYSQPSSVVAIA
ncbi:MAG: hypothetical protein R6T92_01215 [Desulfosalsimonadaceae bacterium]